VKSANRMVAGRFGRLDWRSTRGRRFRGRRRGQIPLESLEITLNGAAHLDQIAARVAQQPIHVTA